MAAVRETLKQLHLYQTELAEVREKLEQGPLELRSRQNELANLERHLHDTRESAKRLRMGADDKEVSLKEGEEKLANLKVKLNLTRSTKEYNTILEEINARKRTNGRFEEEALEMMTDQEAKAAEAERAERSLDEEKEKFARFEEQTKYGLEKLTSRVTFLEQKSTECEQLLDPETREAYARLVRTKGADALAASENGTCGACYTAITPQEREHLSMGKVVRCHTCGTMLYTK